MSHCKEVEKLAEAEKFMLQVRFHRFIFCRIYIDFATNTNEVAIFEYPVYHIV